MIAIKIAFGEWGSFINEGLDEFVSKLSCPYCKGKLSKGGSYERYYYVSIKTPYQQITLPRVECTNCKKNREKDSRIKQHTHALCPLEIIPRWSACFPLITKVFSFIRKHTIEKIERIYKVVERVAVSWLIENKYKKWSEILKSTGSKDFETCREVFGQDTLGKIYLYRYFP
ncbi:MAG: hypothetical protein LBV53_00685 [Mycoplasmataceae bacterium]|jgi:hypothetical protein|nr:hypothetical protein [Mycoplasmataceae bacterium]